jgi:hypothetical protein
MTAPTGKSFPVGMKQARVYALTADGVPAATSTTVYEGIQLVGVQSYENTVPDARRIAHTGDDQVLAQDMLPRQEVSTAKITTAINPMDAYAAMSSTKQATIGSATTIGYATNKQGSEPTVAILMYQQAKEYLSGLRCYRSYEIPATQVIINANGMSADKSAFSFSMLPTAVNHHIWGIQFTANTEGYTTSETEEIQTYGLPHICSWRADGTVTTFPFNSARQAAGTLQINAISTMSPTGGTVTDVTATATKAVGTITIAGPLAVGTIVTCFYEYAAS